MGRGGLLFSGAGGLDVASFLTGVPVVSSTDLDDDCIETLKRNELYKDSKIIKGEMMLLSIPMTRYSSPSIERLMNLFRGFANNIWVFSWMLFGLKLLILQKRMGPSDKGKGRESNAERVMFRKRDRSG